MKKLGSSTPPLARLPGMPTSKQREAAERRASRLLKLLEIDMVHDPARPPLPPRGGEGGLLLRTTHAHAPPPQRIKLNSTAGVRAQAAPLRVNVQQCDGDGNGGRATLQHRAMVRRCARRAGAMPMDLVERRRESGGGGASPKAQLFRNFCVHKADRSALCGDLRHYAMPAPAAGAPSTQPPSCRAACAARFSLRAGSSARNRPPCAARHTWSVSWCRAPQAQRARAWTRTRTRSRTRSRRGISAPLRKRASAVARRRRAPKTRPAQTRPFRTLSRSPRKRRSAGTRTACASWTQR